jgi:polyhydroxyalkanoate synthase
VAKAPAKPAIQTAAGGGAAVPPALPEGGRASGQPDAAGAPAPWLAWWSAAAEAPVIPGLQLSPEKLVELQQDYVARLGSLWSDFVEHPDRNAAPIKDGRFADPSWQQNSLSAFFARTYLLNAEFLSAMANAVDADPKVKARLNFSVSQWIDATSPSNFFALNPQVQKRLLETRGESLTAGLQNLLGDVAKGRISQADESAFEVGRNVATTEGAVVYENEMMQIVQYRPLTPTVRARPFLMVPPCINKFYILDLQKENSFIRYAVERGNTVFVISWRNPHEAQGRWTWDDYLEHGPIEAIEAVRRLCGADQLNVLGFCVGGTLLATALAVLRARGQDPVASVTFLTSLLDFTHAGILDIFIDEAHVQMREATLGGGGLMPGRDLANTFSTLRANDLVWNYYVHNYLEGQRPPAFDLLYWNGDSTNLPGPMYAWYLRNMYLENNLRVPNRLHCAGQPVDLGRIQVPVYVFGAREDHIVPWVGAYESAQALTGVPRGELRFVLGASGHIAGTINSPVKNRRGYWSIDAADGPPVGAALGSQAWLETAQEHKGSWWPDWDRWLARFAGGERPAPAELGGPGCPPIEPAPGRYVKEKA